MSYLDRANDKHPSNYAEYLSLHDDERWEIIDGVAFNMTPAPTTLHQRVVRRLSGEFYRNLEGKSCEYFIAPFDVRLVADGKSDEEIKNVVQPDLIVICDPSKIDERGCKGSPDLIVEVLSPSTAKKDRTEKLRLYRKAEVKEYWIIDPFNETVEVYAFHENRFADATVYVKEDMIQVGGEDGFALDLKVVFG